MSTYTSAENAMNSTLTGFKGTTAYNNANTNSYVSARSAEDTHVNLSSLVKQRLQARIDELEITAVKNPVAKYVDDVKSTVETGFTNVENDMVKVKDSVLLVQESVDSANSRAVAQENAIQGELDATQTGTGVSNVGAYVQYTTGQYINNASSIHDATTKLDDSLKATDAALAAEITRATGVEGTLSSRIDDIVSNTDAAALDSLTEIVAAFQGADASLSSAITSALGTHTSELDALATNELGFSGRQYPELLAGSTNYLVDTSNVFGALTALDSTLKTLEDQAGATDDSKVAKAGDTMTGALTISGAELNVLEANVSIGGDTGITGQLLVDQNAIIGSPDLDGEVLKTEGGDVLITKLGINKVTKLGINAGGDAGNFSGNHSRFEMTTRSTVFGDDNFPDFGIAVGGGDARNFMKFVTGHATMTPTDGNALAGNQETTIVEYNSLLDPNLYNDPKFYTKYNIPLLSTDTLRVVPDGTTHLNVEDQVGVEIQVPVPDFATIAFNGGYHDGADMKRNTNKSRFRMMHDTRASVDRFAVELWDTSDNISHPLTLTKDSNVAIGKLSADGKLDVVGDMISHFNDGNIRGSLQLGENPNVANKVGALVSYNSFDNYMTIDSKRKMYFRTYATDADTSPLTAMMINDSQNIGLGNNDPAVKLDINGDLRLRGIDDYIYFIQDPEALNKVGGSIRHSDRFYFTSRGKDIWFRTGTTTSNLDLAMSIKESGNVGIGTDTPSEKLHVAGNLFVGNDETENKIMFRGVADDPTSSTGHGEYTVLAERLYAGNDKSELYLFKGNDHSTVNGPDRIRHRSAEHVFQTYTSGEEYSSSNDNNTRFIIKNDGKIGINTTEPTENLHVNGTAKVSGATTLDSTLAVASTSSFNGNMTVYADMVTTGKMSFLNGTGLDIYGGYGHVSTDNRGYSVTANVAADTDSGLVIKGKASDADISNGLAGFQDFRDIATFFSSNNTSSFNLIAVADRDQGLKVDGVMQVEGNLALRKDLYVEQDMHVKGTVGGYLEDADGNRTLEGNWNRYIKELREDIDTLTEYVLAQSA